MGACSSRKADPQLTNASARSAKHSEELRDFRRAFARVFPTRVPPPTRRATSGRKKPLNLALGLERGGREMSNVRGGCYGPRERRWHGNELRGVVPRELPIACRSEGRFHQQRRMSQYGSSVAEAGISA